MFLLILFFFVVGIVVNRFSLAPQQFSTTLNKGVIYIAYPAAILLTVPSLHFSTTILFPIAAYWLMLPVIGIIVWGLGRHKQWPSDTKLAVFVLLSCGNTAFLGLPMVQALWHSEQALAYALIYDQFGSFIALSTLITVLIGSYNATGSRPNATAVVRHIMSFPPFIALLVSLTLPIQSMVDALQLPLLWLSRLIIPLTMTAIGMRFTVKLDKSIRYPLISVIAIKTIALPLIVLAIGSILGVDALVVALTVFQTAMPTMVTAAAMLVAAGICAPLVTATISFSTLLAFVMLPLYAKLLGAY